MDTHICGFNSPPNGFRPLGGEMKAGEEIREPVAPLPSPLPLGEREQEVASCREQHRFVGFDSAHRPVDAHPVLRPSGSLSPRGRGAIGPSSSSYSPSMPRRFENYPTERARTLRQSQSPPEGVLWSRLRAGRLRGFKFRRQHPIGPYVVDFACCEVMLVVELDSNYHRGQHERDARRDRVVGEFGWRVLRITASQLAKDERLVLSWILRAAREGARRKDTADETRRGEIERGETEKKKIG